MQEVAESQQEVKEEDVKEASSTAGLLEKLSVDDKKSEKEEVKESSKTEDSEKKEETPIAASWMNLKQIRSNLYYAIYYVFILCFAEEVVWYDDDELCF